MNCKFCNAELPEEVTLCPACGQDNAAEVTEETAVTETEKTTEEATVTENEEITEECSTV